MPSLDSPFGVFGPDPTALKLLIASILVIESDGPKCHVVPETDLPKEIADKAEIYSQYLSLFFIVTRRRKVSTSPSGPSRGSEVKGADG